MMRANLAAQWMLCLREEQLCSCRTRVTIPRKGETFVLQRFSV